MNPVWGHGVPFILYFPAVVFIAWYGGLCPGLLATALSAVCAMMLFFQPINSVWVADPGDRLKLAAFLLASMVVSVLSEALHRPGSGLYLASQRSEERLRESDIAGGG